MSSVFFDLAVGGDGSAVTDDSNPSTGLANGGHRTRLVPAMAQVVAVAGFVVNKAADAAAAESVATAAAIGLAQFNDVYLGAKTSDPTLDNDGNALQVGAMYWRSSGTVGLKVYTGSAWVYAALSSAIAAGVSLTPVGQITATDMQSSAAQIDQRISSESIHASAQSATYNGSGQLTGITETVDGYTRSTTLTYNSDGTLNTEAITYRGVTKTRTHSYSSSQWSGSTEV